MKKLEPGIFRQRLIIEGKQGIKITSQLIKEYLTKLTLDVLCMRIQIGPIVFSPNKFRHPLHHGLNGFIGWVESGGQFYSWDKLNFFTMDIYSCKKFNPKKVVEFTKEFFKAKEIVYKEV